MEENGYTVESEPVDNLADIKQEHHIPPQLHSCHTAIVDGYIIEGHVPVEDIERLLAERPDITGLAVPGMPVGSPGMEVEGAPEQPYDVIAFGEGGQTEVFASHSQ